MNTLQNIIKSVQRAQQAVENAVSTLEPSQYKNEPVKIQVQQLRTAGNQLNESLRDLQDAGTAGTDDTPDPTENLHVHPVTGRSIHAPVDTSGNRPDTVLPGQPARGAANPDGPVGPVGIPGPRGTEGTPGKIETETIPASELGKVEPDDDDDDDDDGDDDDDNDDKKNDGEPDVEGLPSAVRTTPKPPKRR